MSEMRKLTVNEQVDNLLRRLDSAYSSGDPAIITLAAIIEDILEMIRREAAEP